MHTQQTTQTNYSIELPRGSHQAEKLANRIRESILKHFGSAWDTGDALYFECAKSDSDYARRFVERLQGLAKVVSK